MGAAAVSRDPVRRAARGADPDARRAADLGLFNHLGVQWDPKRGWYDVREGATYVQTVSFTDDAACPIDAQTVLGHGLSTDPTSPWFSNGTKLLGQKRWTPQAFRQAHVRRTVKVAAGSGKSRRAGTGILSILGGSLPCRFPSRGP